MSRKSPRRDKASDLVLSWGTFINLNDHERQQGRVSYTRGVKDKASGHRKAAIWAAIGVGLGVVIGGLMVELPRFRRERSLAGAVLIANADPRKQLPVPNVEITAEAGGTAVRAKSDASGFFRLNWPSGVWRGEQVLLSFRHPDYQPLDITRHLTGELYIARMTSSSSIKDVESDRQEVTLTGIRVRYAVKATTTINIGSVAKTLEVVNTGNVPCDPRSPCAPDRKWKAAIGTISLDAGEGQQFQNVRISCIAGPCSFTKIESDAFSSGGRKIGFSVRAWSDTVTFLVEADVVRSMLSDTIRRAYPSIFGRAMTFTLPPTGEGPSIEAEVNGLEIVFPLGPDLSLSWASCSVQVPSNQPKLYSCELKPGYRFR
jgi:hypothetical protein